MPINIDRDRDGFIGFQRLELLQGIPAQIGRFGRGTYTLTTKGQRYVGAFSTDTNKQHEYIKTVVVLYAKAPDGRYLLFRWSRQPYINRVGLLHDHMPLGKSLQDGVASAMQDKLGTVLEPTYLTSPLIKIERGGELVTHMNALTYKVNVAESALPYESRNGTAFFGNVHTTEGIMDGLAQLLHGVEKLREPAEFILEY